MLAAATVAACSSGDGSEREAPDVTVSDSAGVEIVVSGAPPASGMLVLAPEPEVSIGEFESEDPEQQLHRVTGAMLLDDGTIVVANEGSSQLRFFDALSGEFMRAAGGPGGGPGEFTSMRWLGRTAGDTILVYDMMNNRLSRFAPSGEFVNDVTINAGGPGAQMFGLLDDGTLLLRSTVMLTAGEDPSGLIRPTATVLRADRGGVILDTLGVFPGTERVIVSAGSSESRTMAVMPPPYGRSSFMSAHDDAVAVGVSDSYEIRFLDGDGAVRRLVRRSTPPVQVTAADRAAFTESRLKSLPEQLRAPFRSTLDGMTHPETMPAFLDVRFDDTGRLWVRESVNEGEMQRWAIYDRDGALEGELRLPDEFKLMSAGSDYVLGVMPDELEVERVQLLRVLRDRGRS